MGCAIVITSKGFTRDYFGDHAHYCDPAEPASILAAVNKAAEKGGDPVLQNKIVTAYTWDQAAAKTLAVYQQILTACAN
jgi:glycosyltransferase involved in cell wall biosynthesis